MKYKIKKNDDGKFEVFDTIQGGLDVAVASFDTKEEAEAYRLKDKHREHSFELEGAVVTYDFSDTVSIKDVELFAVGTWKGVNSPPKGDKYTVSDLEDMVKAFDSKVISPVLKLTHGADNDQPEIGKIENLRVRGEKLLGDFVNVPKSLRDFMKQTGAFARRSAEVFWGYRDNAGKTWRRVLKACALLAPGQNPAVGALTDGYKFEFEYAYELNPEKKGGDNMELKELLKKYNCETVADLVVMIEAGKLSAEEVKSFRTKIADVNADSVKQFIEAEKKRGAILPAHEGLIEALFEACSTVEKTRDYTVGTEKKTGTATEILKTFIGALPNLVDLEERSQKSEDDDVNTEKPASDEVERLAAQYQEDGKAKDYAGALKVIQTKHPKLWVAYNEGTKPTS